MSTLKAFWTEQSEYTDAMEPTLAWYRHTQHADWGSPNDVKRDFGNASILKDGRVVFNIAGNKYRLIVRINYVSMTVFVRFVGTHKEYDKINAEAI